MNAEQLAHALGGAKRNGRRWNALCPAHDDHDPSLGITDGDGGKLLLHCYAGCSQDHVLDALRSRGLWEEPREKASRNSHRHTKNGAGHHKAEGEDWHPIVPPPNGTPKPTTEQLRCDMLHEYFGADDQILFYVRRHEAKDSQRKQFFPLTYGVRGGKKGWHDRAPDAPRPLYGLNRLSHAEPDATVLLVEGEKKADAAMRMFPDYVAVAWMGGSKAESLADLSPLDSRNVVIWPDADEAGREAAARLGRRLPNARAVDVAGLPDRFDAADLECSGEDDPLAWLESRLHDLAQSLSAAAWLTRQLPPIDRLLGDFITTTTRAFLVGRTGLGKTMFGLACAIGMAFGAGFLHWRSERPARVLYIDGEMPAELLIQRIKDAARRIGREDLIGNLMVFSTEDAEDIAARFPMLGMFEPLNTDPGQDFMKRLCGTLRPDAIILDNVQSLLAGVQKEEETWIPTLPLVQWLTKQRIGQLWLDHTGHVADRQYGTATKSWRMDALGHMAPLPDDQQIPNETAFTLSFDPPAGKARRRTPDNWQEFAPHIIRLRADRWTSEPVEKPGAGGKLGKVAPARQPFYDALVAAIGKTPRSRGRTTEATWELECLRRGLIERPPEDGKESGARRDGRRRNYRKAKSDLIAGRWIAVDGQDVIDLKGRWE